MVGAVSGEGSWVTLQRNSDERPNASRMRNAESEKRNTKAGARASKWEIQQ
jgi:hypothetical protein